MTLIIDSGFNYDTDASAYIDAVEVADGQSLETATRYAINNFVIGCKQDGIWTAIKSCCILAGARTLSGALVPLVGTAPTNISNLFVSGDYNRKTGLKSDGSTKYLNSNYTLTNRDNAHLAAYTTENRTTGQYVILGAQVTGASRILMHQDDVSGGKALHFVNNDYVEWVPTGFPLNGFRGVERSGLSPMSSRVTGKTYNTNRNAVSLVTVPIYIFAENNNNSVNAITNFRLSFYSLGETLNLIALESRVNDLMTAIGSAF